jgi:hypothetical protein
MQRKMRGFFHCAKGNKANLVALARFFERPADACIPRQPLAAIRRSFERGNGDGHRQAPRWQGAFTTKPGSASLYAQLNGALRISLCRQRPVSYW